MEWKGRKGSSPTKSGTINSGKESDKEPPRKKENGRKQNLKRREGRIGMYKGRASEQSVLAVRNGGT